MFKQISLFNHKGGVSKTTTAFNLGWMLSQKGKRVLLVDCDPQCNLTGMFFGFKGSSELEEVYSKPGIRNIRDGLAPAFESKPVALSAVTCESIPANDRLLMLPGHIKLAEYETTLGISQELSGSLVTLQNLPGAPHALISLTAEKYDIDIVLVDMSPSLGPVNQNMLVTSDYFLIPMAPDYFSAMAVDSVSSILPKWKRWASAARDFPVFRDSAYPLPRCEPKFLGSIIQKYRVREGVTASAAFQRWIDEIQKRVENTLIPALRGADMLLSEDTYKDAGFPLPQAILQMSDFNGLIAQSQKHSSPVFALTDEQLEQTGIILERTKKSMERFEMLFSACADRIIYILENE